MSKEKCWLCEKEKKGGFYHWCAECWLEDKASIIDQLMGIRADLTAERDTYRNTVKVLWDIAEVAQKAAHRIHEEYRRATLYPFDEIMELGNLFQKETKPGDWTLLEVQDVVDSLIKGK
jgi:hypothetical protein